MAVVQLFTLDSVTYLKIEKRSPNSSPKNWKIMYDLEGY